MGVLYSTNPTPTYTKIGAQTLTGNSTSVTFSNIPQNFTDLVIIVSGVGAVQDGYSILCQVGNTSIDTGSNYSTTRIGGNGTATSSGRATAASYMRLQNLTGQSTTSGNVTNLLINFMNYSNGTTFKSVINRANQTNGSYPGVELLINLWRNTSPINIIQLFPFTGASFATGSTFTLYGIECAKTPKADGGIITTDGTYWIHTFTNSGLFVPKQSLTCDYLVVAGGGGGGGLQEWGGGGGAGGLRSTVTATGGGGSLESALSLSSGIGYTVTVGAGGAGKPIRGTGNQGSNSTFSTITSTGGGGGGGITRSPDVANAPTTGGSGGGGEVLPSTFTGTNTGAAGTTNQGYAGGNGYSSPTVYNYSKAGGGGGAGGVGQTGQQGTSSSSPSSPAGNGGNGVAVSISGFSVTYGGGGAGGAYFSTITSTGGSGGGGNGGNSSNNASNGTSNTGGGGGGNGSTSTGSGGSGIVIVRYAV